MTGRGLAGNIRRRFRRGSPKSVLGSVRRPGNESGSRDTQQTRFGRSHHGIGPVRRLEFWIGVCRLGHGVFRSVSFLCQSPFVWRNRGQIAAERGLGLNSTLLIANVINLGADLGSMGAVSQMLTGGLRWPYVVAFGLICIAMQVLLEYTRYVKVLKWLTLSLLAYFGTAFTVAIPWQEGLHGLLVPSWQNSKDYISLVVAVLGTTISPYLYFWQASQEAEDQREQRLGEKLAVAPEQAPAAFQRIGIDTWTGMALSNLVALAIMLTAGATLHASGNTDIDSAQTAAEALRPVAGELSFLIFALGIIGTGFMAVPVLAGSAAYAVEEALRWPIGLARRPKAARAFYLTLATATAIGTAINFLPLDPMRALYWSAVINGVMAAPIIVVIMKLARRRNHPVCRRNCLTPRAKPEAGDLILG
jgi:Mn2+/Fe2+ NRAMP family transporter